MAIRVRATRQGLYVSIRNKGDIFQIIGPKDIGSWMEPVDKKDEKVFAAEKARRLKRRAASFGPSKLQKQAEAKGRKFAAKNERNRAAIEADDDDDLGL